MEPVPASGRSVESELPRDRHLLPSLGSKADAIRLLDEAGRPVTTPTPGDATVIVFYRGDWCPWCNGQLATLARSGRVRALKVTIVGVSVDSPTRNRAMRRKLQLPFVLLNDPDGEGIRRYGCWNESEQIAHPAVFVVAGDGTIVHTQLGVGYADRETEAQLCDAVEAVA